MTSEQINEVVRGFGVVALADLNAERIYFFPRGKLPKQVVAWLDEEGGRRAKSLRNFLIVKLLSGRPLGAR